tara:strand:- start:989 stop:1765 length:777 start_codon:yes stop_codon:yes gene_type:complete
MARYAPNRFGRYSRGSSSFNSSGTVYKTGAAAYEVRRHSLKREIEIEPSQAKIIPLIAFSDTEGLSTAISGVSTKIAAAGSKVYPTIAVQEGSKVASMKLDITIEPKTQNSSNIINFYTGRIVASYHDVKGQGIYGLEPDGTTGKTKYSDEAGSPTTTDVITSTGSTGSPPALPLEKDVYDYGDTIKHWWRNPRKNVMFGGQPIVYERWEKVPSKCTRSNQGMFYGLFVMNSASSVSGDTDVLKFNIRQEFNEIPLIQ